jgi:hypothetical protein
MCLFATCGWAKKEQLLKLPTTEVCVIKYHSARIGLLHDPVCWTPEEEWKKSCRLLF